MSAKSKGQSFETRVAEDLKKKGYEILFKSRWARWGMIDFAGLWDICYWNKERKGFGFVQVKTQKADTYGLKGKPYRDFADTHRAANALYAFATRNKEMEIEYEVI